MSRSEGRVEMEEEEVRMRGISIRRKMIDESKTYGFRLMGLFLKPLILGQSYPSSEFIGP
jgi:hypothetical protein